MGPGEEWGTQRKGSEITGSKANLSGVTEISLLPAVNCSIFSFSAIG